MIYEGPSLSLSFVISFSDKKKTNKLSPNYILLWILYFHNENAIIRLKVYQTIRYLWSKQRSWSPLPFRNIHSICYSYMNFNKKKNAYNFARIYAVYKLDDAWISSHMDALYMHACNGFLKKCAKFLAYFHSTAFDLLLAQRKMLWINKQSVIIARIINPGTLIFSDSEAMKMLKFCPSFSLFGRYSQYWVTVLQFWFMTNIQQA